MADRRLGISLERGRAARDERLLRCALRNDLRLFVAHFSFPFGFTASTLPAPAGCFHEKMFLKFT